jgi:hypothetical protein
LRGPLPDRRVLAAQILGRIRSSRAIETLETLLDTPGVGSLASSGSAAGLTSLRREYAS